AAAMRDAGISDPADVHYVQAKCPLLTRERIAAAEARGRTCATGDTYESMARSRGASALGVAVALGEIAAKSRSEAAICRDYELYSGRAGTSAGIELMRNEIMLLGNAAGWAGDLRITHGVMADAIDMEAGRAALAGLGLACAGQLDAAARGRVVA